MIELFLAGAVAALVLVTVAVLVAVPAELAWSERIIVRAAPALVYDALRLQKNVKFWSARPAATHTRADLSGTDGEAGARLAFRTRNGAAAFAQEVTALEPQRRVALRYEALADGWLLQAPEGEYELTPVAGGTAVTYTYRNVFEPPHQLLAWGIGDVARTRRMQRAELQALKRACELTAQRGTDVSAWTSADYAEARATLAPQRTTA